MLHHRHQLDVGETHVGDVIAQLGREFAIVERAIIVVGLAPPRAEMHLVNGDRSFEDVAMRARLHPFAVAKFVARPAYHRGGRGRQLHQRGEGIRFEQQVAVAGANLEFVLGAFAHLGNEDFPHPGAAERAHHVEPPVPAVEIADDADTPRIRRPYRERDAMGATHLAQMRAQLVIHAIVLALGP